jgi:putative endonuclease
MTFARINSGKRGEAIAISYLKKHGYKIVEKNYKTKLGEIDIIADCKGCTCFIEVRTRNNQAFGLPEEAILKKKQLHITKAALSYIKRYKLENEPCRFDVVSIQYVDSLNPEIKLIKDAFELDTRYNY